MTLIEDINNNLSALNDGLGSLVGSIQGVEDGVDRLIAKIQELIAAGGATPAQLQIIMDGLVEAQSTLAQGAQIAQEALDKEATVV